MALVVLIKGVNVGGHRTFRPTAMAKSLRRFGAINIGAAGTFITRGRVSRTELRAAIRRLLPFEAEVIICDGREIRRLSSQDPFAGQPSSPEIVRFVSVSANRRPLLSVLPLDLPATGRWGLRVLAQHDRFILGLYRREMKAISNLARLEKIIGVPITTRSWSTIHLLARRLERPVSSRGRRPRGQWPGIHDAQNKPRNDLAKRRSEPPPRAFTFSMTERHSVEAKLCSGGSRSAGYR
jgi:uncharacterized protein (DUF1697 family)